MSITTLEIIGYLFFLLFLALSAILWPVMIVRTALNKNLSDVEKTLWILGEVYIFPIAYIYAIFREKRRMWNILAIVSVIGLLAPIVLWLVLVMSRTTIFHK